MILPSTAWMTMAAACAGACALAVSLWLAVMKFRTYQKLRSEAKRELDNAENEVYAAVHGGDANRVRRARRRLQIALDEARRYGVG